MLYMTNGRPILEYACTGWDLHIWSSMDQLERIQKREAQFVSGNYDFSKNSSAICKELGWPLLADRRKYLRLSLFYNIFNGRNPTYVSPRTDHHLTVPEYRSRKSIFKYEFFSENCERMEKPTRENSPLNSFVFFSSFFFFRFCSTFCLVKCQFVILTAGVFADLLFLFCCKFSFLMSLELFPNHAYFRCITLYFICVCVCVFGCFFFVLFPLYNNALFMSM